MAIDPPKLELTKFPSSVSNLYHEGRNIPFALYHYTERLFNFPAYSKERAIAHKLESDLKNYAALHAPTKKQTTKTTNYFLAHKDELEYEDIDVFYENLETLLKKTPSVVYTFTPQQFNDLKLAFDIYAQQQDNQLLLYQHGNQTLTGAPYVIGGHPHLDYFLWGNLFGVVKYTEQGGEEYNYHVYFEHKQERTLEQAMHNLLIKLEQQTEPAHTMESPEAAPPQPVPSGAPQLGENMSPGANETEE